MRIDGYLENNPSKKLILCRKTRVAWIPKLIDKKPHICKNKSVVEIVLDSDGFNLSKYGSRNYDFTLRIFLLSISSIIYSNVYSLLDFLKKRAIMAHSYNDLTPKWFILLASSLTKKSSWGGF